MAVKKRKFKTQYPDYQIFISHATADKWIAKVICEKIEGVGASTFRDDRDIDGGDDIPDEIRQQIKRSREMIVLFTPESVDRAWILLEIGAAWGWRKDFPIVPIRNHIEIDPIPDIIKSKKAITLNDFDSYLTEVSKKVKKGEDV